MTASSEDLCFLFSLCFFFFFSDQFVSLFKMDMRPSSSLSESTMTASSEDLCFLFSFFLYPSLSDESVMLVTSFSTLTSDFNPGGRAGPKPSSLEEELPSLDLLTNSLDSLGGELDGLRGLLLEVLLFRVSKSMFAKIPLAGSLDRRTFPFLSSHGFAGSLIFSAFACCSRSLAAVSAAVSSFPSSSSSFSDSSSDESAKMALKRSMGGLGTITSSSSSSSLISSVDVFGACSPFFSDSSVLSTGTSWTFSRAAKTLVTPVSRLAGLAVPVVLVSEYGCATLNLTQSSRAGCHSSLVLVKAPNIPMEAASTPPSFFTTSPVPPPSSTVTESPAETNLDPITPFIGWKSIDARSNSSFSFSLSHSVIDRGWSERNTSGLLFSKQTLYWSYRFCFSGLRANGLKAPSDLISPLRRKSGSLTGGSRGSSTFTSLFAWSGKSTDLRCSTDGFVPPLL